MTDLELIKFAAKASGFEYTKDENPLESDSLAFRLAVALQLCIDMDRYMNEVSVEVDGCSYEECLRDTDPYKATRRAIVRAAAEIGKKKGNYE